ncbi:restriction endonuclease fold toxin 5 domain-containing protein [Burkholderia ambifaria]|uniref:restriction endonuclease fold toxin 5 domain-containing protein n=1 Tax=Burkholderia ambifaria TaxID=152480 RepID=UPI001589E54A|nr:restriction endonuclease fold toxin 5 domain-containing protein [Burkholderia ambifaria]
MAAALPLLEGVLAELGPVLARAGAALLGGVGLAGTASLSSDTTKDESKAKTDAKAVPRTGEKCKKCPPEETGIAKNKVHHMSNHSREYQARITGRPYSNEGKWNEEWLFEGIYFDGFLPAECMLQEAKSRYAKFLQRDKYGELEPVDWFEGWPSTISDISRQADAVNPFPPTRLTWYFEEPEPREYLLKELMRNSVLSVVQP